MKPKTHPKRDNEDGPHMSNVTANILTNRRNYIKLRADADGRSISNMTGRIIDAWFTAGCPALSSSEKPLPYSEDKKY